MELSLGPLTSEIPAGPAPVQYLTQALNLNPGRKLKNRSTLGGTMYTLGFFVIWPQFLCA
jgi:hypothetical protein